MAWAVHKILNFTNLISIKVAYTSEVHSHLLILVVIISILALNSFII